MDRAINITHHIDFQSSPIRKQRNRFNLLQSYVQNIIWVFYKLVWLAKIREKSRVFWEFWRLLWDGLYKVVQLCEGTRDRCLQGQLLRRRLALLDMVMDSIRSVCSHVFVISTICNLSESDTTNLLQRRYTKVFHWVSYFWAQRFVIVDILRNCLDRATRYILDLLERGSIIALPSLLNFKVVKSEFFLRES